MKKIIYILFACITASSLVSCLKSDDPYTEYSDWLAINENWFTEQEQLKDEYGNNFYTKVTPSFDNDAAILMHWFNDRSKTRGNLSPKYTSTVDVKYIGRIITGDAFDSSYLSTKPADSLFRTNLESVIDGWGIALMQMHVGDSCRVVIPYDLGYGPASMGTVIMPFSNLIFDLKLVGIPAYETKFSD